MPMPIANLDEYDKVVNVSWFTPDKPREELRHVASRNSRSKLTLLAFLLFSHFLRCTHFVV